MGKQNRKLIENINSMEKLDKYKENLRILKGNEVWSYSTHVANITDKGVEQLGWWSQTTQKHINYVGQYYDLKVYEAE
jgi:hypothetical protein